MVPITWCVSCLALKIKEDVLIRYPLLFFHIFLICHFSQMKSLTLIQQNHRITTMNLWMILIIGSANADGEILPSFFQYIPGWEGGYTARYSLSAPSNVLSIKITHHLIYCFNTSANTYNTFTSTIIHLKHFRIFAFIEFNFQMWTICFIIF